MASTVNKTVNRKLVFNSFGGSMKLLFLCILSVLFSACRSTKSLQKEVNTLDADLYYELTSNVYTDDIKKEVFLNFIDYSNLDYYTTIKKKKSILVPLIIYFYSYQVFEVTLGEASLTQNYREFLTEALLAECNRSTCFNLLDNTQEENASASYFLNVTIKQNKTTSKIKLRDHLFFAWFGGDLDDEFLEAFDNYKTEPAVTDLALEVSLLHHEEELLKKRYFINRKHGTRRKGLADTYNANEVCLQTMAESLSYATKFLVEDIAQELHLLLFD